VVPWVPTAMANSMNRCRQLLRSSTRAAFVSGFAYIWLLFVVAFMGLGLSVGAELNATSQQRDKERELLSLGRQFRQAIARYYETQPSPNAASQRQYPTSLEDLLQDSRSLAVKRHLRKIFIDPMTGKAEWGVYRSGGRVVGVYSLSDKEPIKQDGFESDDTSFRGKAKYSEWVFAYPADALVKLESNSGLAKPAPDTPATPASSPQLTASNPATGVPQTAPKPAKTD
jgi:type II secretory pathway pseudopilin PulG